ncbi:MAG: ribosomal-processing cysteine protease Prp [Eubacterium sp.]|nr:ribosomal-processing cysteine protease Prp [Eubacterium sp.]
MITAVFTECNGKLIGFSLSGHSDYDESRQDIVCAGISSALMLTVNTITDFIKADAKIDVDPENEGYASLLLTAPYNENAVNMIESFYAHLCGIEEDYGQIKLRKSKI